MSKAWHRLWLIGGLVVALLVSAAYPVETVTVPEWRIQFTDVKGRPFKGLPVRQTWQNYSLETRSHEETAVTDNDGYVNFSERRLITSPLMQLLGPVLSFGRSAFHASFGPSSWIIPLCNLIEVGPGMTIYRGGDLPAQARLRRSSLDQVAISKCEAIDQQAIEAGAPNTGVQPTPTSGRG